MGSQFRTRNYRPYGIVHITARGHNRRVVFIDEIDRAMFMSHLRTLIDRIDPSIRPSLLACAQMPNHVHLLFQHGKDPHAVPRLMHALSVKYAQYFNARHGLSGAVWTRPFRGRVVRGGEDLVNVVTYIHLNPDASVRTENSSHAVYLGNKPSGLINTDLVLKTFGGRSNYAMYFADTANLRAARTAAKRRINQ